MTTISHNRHKRHYVVPVLLGVALVVFIIVVGFLRVQTTSLLFRAVAPVIALRNSLDTTENARLRAALASTTALIADRDVLYQENTYLKSQFGRPATSSASAGVLASVLMRPPQTPYDTLLIDAGSKQGVAAGNRVYAGGNVLIGTVSEVYDTNARVTLLSAPGLTYQGFVHQKLPISIEGQGGGSMRGSVPAGSNVVPGDAVLLPGIAPTYAATVSHVDAISGESFETVYMHMPVDLFELSFVVVRHD